MKFGEIDVETEGMDDDFVGDVDPNLLKDSPLMDEFNFDFTSEDLFANFANSLLDDDFDQLPLPLPPEEPESPNVNGAYLGFEELEVDPIVSEIKPEPASLEVVVDDGCWITTPCVGAEVDIHNPTFKEEWTGPYTPPDSEKSECSGSEPSPPASPTGLPVLTIVNTESTQPKFSRVVGRSSAPGTIGPAQRTILVRTGGSLPVLQPKLSPPPLAPITPPSNNAGPCPKAQRLLLTPAELVKLTSQGLLKIVNHQSQPAQTQPRPSPSPPVGQPRTTCPQTSNLAPNQDMDIKALRRQQRMIRNRESAFTSRRKRKEYVSSLEDRLKDLSSENQKLVTENLQLKQRLCSLQNENEFLKKIKTTSTSKKATALLAVLFMVTLNLGPLSGIFLSQDRVPTLQTTMTEPHGGGRHLLWSMTNKQQATSAEEEDNFNSIDSMEYVNTTLTNRTKCQEYVNSTDSLRLDNELRGLVFHKKRWNYDKPISKSAKPVRKHVPVSLPLPKLRSMPLEEWSGVNKHFPYPPERGLQVYDRPPTINKNLDSLLASLQPRDDTYYVISFSGNHLLLPALAHNNSKRPLVSLVLPAFSLNESMSAPKDHISMMQIDCEVKSTKLMHVMESLIPEHMRSGNHANRTDTSEESPPGETARTTPPRKPAAKPHRNPSNITEWFP